jgi:hypothetical protein
MCGENGMVWSIVCYLEGWAGGGGAWQMLPISLHYLARGGGGAGGLHSLPMMQIGAVVKG